MKEFEDMVCDHIKETGNHVMYRATPVFVGDNLLATGVLLEAYSVEDGGYGIEFCIFIHNVQSEYNIDYATGDATVTEDGMINNYKFVVGTGNYKIHLSTCRYVANIKEANRLYMNGTYQEVYDYCVSLGKSPTACGTCKPQNSARHIYCILPDKKLAPVITKTRRAA
jgi:DNA-entry nuclease